MRARIVEVTRDRFFAYGYSSVTTSDIASELGISKKTLYRYFPSKRQLLREVVMATAQEIELQVRGIVLDSELEFAEKLRRFLEIISSRISRIGQPLVRDLRRSAPEVWKELESFRRESVFNRFRGLLEAGIAEGRIRRDIDLDLLMLIFVSIVDGVINVDVAVRVSHSMIELADAALKVFLEGALVSGETVRDALRSDNDNNDTVQENR
jgi:AcrR family transcriptional regulator